MRRVVAVAVCAAAVVGGACGERPEYDRVVARAGERALDKGSARVTYRMSMELAEPVGDVDVTGKGVVDFDKQQGRIEMTMSGTPVPMGDIEIVTDGLVSYMKFPELTEMLPEPTPWIRIDLQKAGEQMGINLDQLMQFGQNNPAQGLDYLAGAQDVEKAGSETVRGVRATRYEATVSFEQLGRELPEEMQPSIDRIQELTGIDEIPTVVWIDEEGLPRRFRYEYEFDPPDDAPIGTPEGNMTMVMDLFDYGTQVNIRPPPANKVTDISELAPQN